MPSSSRSAGLSSRAVITSWLNASVANARREYAIASTNTPRKGAHMAFEVPPLPYDYDALEPHIDEQTMRVHHDKHHQAYVDNANAALEGTEWAETDVDEVLRNLDQLPDDIRTAVRNNGGGHSNHSFFWQIISPDGGRSEE